MAKATRKPTILNPGPGISRIDHAGSRTFGFFVRIGSKQTPRGRRPLFRKFFADKAHGGKKSALAAAVEWADAMRRKVKPAKRAKATSRAA